MVAVVPSSPQPGLPRVSGFGCECASADLGVPLLRFGLDPCRGFFVALFSLRSSVPGLVRQLGVAILTKRGRWRTDEGEWGF